MIDREAAALIGLGEMVRERDEARKDADEWARSFCAVQVQRNEALQTLRAINALAQKSFNLPRGRMLSALIRIEEMSFSATKEAAQ